MLLSFKLNGNLQIETDSQAINEALVHPICHSKKSDDISQNLEDVPCTGTQFDIMKFK